jgi:hypothetical protein
MATVETALGYSLTGIGYREQELQTAKGTIFSNELAQGVKYVSMAGGTHIFIKSPDLNESPPMNMIVLYSHDF